ncbi:pantoate/beta-alanine ligase [Pedosphaera parvula Ellin514]|uniref:Pantothenate synthetase n=2 Tax=Pedosphaera TaxID=1032526 RepID=B9XM05_PEDPL|nr:pantoate/beta-alanine ligase [Pedosphaera parvula Ellin514]
MVTSVSAMQRLAKSWQRKGVRVGFVPTMGYLHAGHLSLVKRARQIVGKQGVVVVSIYVNPTQFAPTEDLSRYPRDLDGDKKLCREAGVDIIFVPASKEMYPPEGGGFSTYVVEENLSKSMEGESRPTHFRGVTTVVAKLFNIVLPEVAVFGAKDFQQAAVVQQMVHDLNFPLKIVVVPTHREPDGLAMSSRNKYLSLEERPQALALSRAIQQAQRLVHHSKRPIAAEKLQTTLAKLISEHPAARIDYIAFFDPQTLRPLEKVSRGVQMALAVFIGKTRLIDNAKL